MNPATNKQKKVKLYIFLRFTLQKMYKNPQKIFQN